MPFGRVAVCKRHSGEVVTQPGLALTPAKMLQMAQDGVPISSINAESFYDDGQRTPPDVPTLDRQRGVDLGDLWENNMDIRKKMRKLKSMQSSESQTD